MAYRKQEDRSAGCGGAVAHLKTCSVEGCDASAAHADGGRNGLCCRHYQRVRKHGDPTRTLIANPGQPLAYVGDLIARGEWPADKCIIWPFGRGGGGYPALRVNGVRTTAHVEICRRVHGEKPSPDHEVRHLCGRGTDGCVNPAHLTWGTHAENMADLVEHGTKTPARGQQQWKAKLTEHAVKAIRAALAKGEPQASIARRFGVTRCSINAIRRGRTWAWLA